MNQKTHQTQAFGIGAKGLLMKLLQIENFLERLLLQKFLLFDVELLLKLLIF